MRRILCLGSMIVIAATTFETAYAQTDHYLPGVYNIRDFALPAAGYYPMIYTYGYLTDDLRNSSGDRVDSVTIQGPGGRVSTTLNVGIDVNLFAMAPTLVWVPKWKFFGVKYGIMISPSFANASLSGLLSVAERSGQSVHTAQFNIGDTFVVPFWLDWTGKHYDISAIYGFYIPTGKYSIVTANVPVVGPVRVASPDNTGLGFWENQTQGAFYLYPWADRRMAIENAITWEIDQKTRGFDLNNGDYLTWNWGVSEFLPLKKDKSLLAELGFAGYGSFQVTDNTGTDARNPDLHEKVYAAGIQAGLTFPKRTMILNFHWFHEFDAANRFEGTALGASIVIKVPPGPQ
jgi:hypothetical protein